MLKVLILVCSFCVSFVGRYSKLCSAVLDESDLFVVNVVEVESRNSRNFDHDRRPYRVWRHEQLAEGARPPSPVQSRGEEQSAQRQWPDWAAVAQADGGKRVYNSWAYMQDEVWHWRVLERYGGSTVLDAIKRFQASFDRPILLQADVSSRRTSADDADRHKGRGNSLPAQQSFSLGAFNPSFASLSVQTIKKLERLQRTTLPKTAKYLATLRHCATLCNDLGVAKPRIGDLGNKNFLGNLLDTRKAHQEDAPRSCTSVAILDGEFKTLLQGPLALAEREQPPPEREQPPPGKMLLHPSPVEDARILVTPEGEMQLTYCCWRQRSFQLQGSLRRCTSSFHNETVAFRIYVDQGRKYVVVYEHCYKLLVVWELVKDGVHGSREGGICSMSCQPSAMR